MRLDGKVALITGGARGQGEAHARMIAAQGGKVILGDVLDAQGEAVAADIGKAARYVHLDVTKRGDWERAVEAALGAFGKLNVLVNNAAIHHKVRLEDETTEFFERMLQVNLVGVFQGMQAALPAMRKAGGGSIINISSTAGMQGLVGHAAYGASKWGVRGLTKVAALELGSDHIRVNSIHPGPINTGMMPHDAASLERFAALPLGRHGEPEEVSHLVCFLASDESSFITGREHVIDGGSSL